MSIRRGGNRPNDHYTIVTNHLARDNRLSLKARGMALYLLSHTEGFRTTVETVAKANGCGEMQVRSAMKELEDQGYVTREQPRDEFGRLGPIEYIVTDAPWLSASGKPHTGSDQHKQDDDHGVSAGHDRYAETHARLAQSRPAAPLKKNKGLEEHLEEEQEDQTSSEADASDSDADASCPAEDPHASTADEPDGSQPDGLFASWQGLDQHQQNTRQDQKLAKGDGRSQANGHRSRQARSQLSPEQAEQHKTIMAAWVDTYREEHDSVQPSANRKGQAAREIRALIVAGNDPDRIERAARAAAAAGFATVETQLSMLSNGNGHRNGRDRTAYVPYQDPDDPSVYEEPIQ